MRVAAISHSCVVDVNQAIFAELERAEDIELLLIAPQKWRSALEGETAFTRLASLQSPVAALPVRRSGSLILHSYAGLEPTLRDFGPDVIYADEEPHSAVAFLAARCARKLSARFVFSTKQNVFRRYPWPISRLERLAYQCSAAAVVVNQEVANVLRAKGYRGQVSIIPHGIDPSVFRPGSRDEARPPLPTGAPLVGYVGRLAAEKGLLDLLAAARLAWARGLEFRLVFIGEGPLAKPLSEAAARLPAGRCQVIRSVPHRRVAEYIGALELLVLPSRTTPTWKEQFGRVIVEALACEVAVLGSDAGHIPYLIETTGGGMVFHEGDVGDLAAKLETLLIDDELRRDLARRGREVVLRRYTYAAIGKALGRALRSAMGR